MHQKFSQNEPVASLATQQPVQQPAKRSSTVVLIMSVIFSLTIGYLIGQGRADASKRDHSRDGIKSRSESATFLYGSPVMVSRPDPDRPGFAKTTHFELIHVATNTSHPKVDQEVLKDCWVVTISNDQSDYYIKPKN